MLDNIIGINMLYDFYGDLLPQKQREIFKLYYGDNLSLGEIAEDYGLTRQGVHETVKRGEKKLKDFEAKLGLVEKYEKGESILEKIKIDIEELIAARKDDLDLVSKLGEFAEMISRLNQ